MEFDRGRFGFGRGICAGMPVDEPCADGHVDGATTWQATGEAVEELQGLSLREDDEAN